MSTSNHPAFPSQGRDAQGNPTHAMEYGLTKLEYFAGLAMQSIVSDAKQWGDMMQKVGSKGIPFENFCAAASVNFAQALIAELEKE